MIMAIEVEMNLKKNKMRLKSFLRLDEYRSFKDSTPPYVDEKLCLCSKASVEEVKKPS